MKIPKQILHNNKLNPNNFWNQLLRIWGGSKERDTSPIFLTHPLTGLDTSPNETSKLCNNYFTNIAKEIHMNFKPLIPAESHKLVHATKNHKFDLIQITAPAQCQFRDVTNSEVKLLVKKIQSDKSSGITGITSNMFKISAKIWIPQLIFLFNLCLCTNTFPKAWKNTVVIPLFKSGNLKNSSN